MGVSRQRAGSGSPDRRERRTRPGHRCWGELLHHHGVGATWSGKPGALRCPGEREARATSNRRPPPTTTTRAPARQHRAGTIDHGRHAQGVAIDLALDDRTARVSLRRRDEAVRSRRGGPRPRPARRARSRWRCQRPLVSSPSIHRCRVGQAISRPVAFDVVHPLGRSEPALRRVVPQRATKRRRQARIPAPRRPRSLRLAGPWRSRPRPAPQAMATT